MTAVIYARYSSDNQREESIEGQIRECTAYAEKNGITVVKHYIDRALSAKTDNRPDFQQMIKDSEKRLFDIVLVWKLDRFARNRYDSAHYEYQLERNHVKLVSATEPISDSPAGIMVKSMLTGMAEYYSAELSEKVVRGMTENVLKGKYNGGTIPIGFKVDEEKFFQIDPLKAPFVVEAFQRYNDGATMKELMNWLNAIQAGVLTNSTKSRLEKLEAQQKELEARIAEEKIARPRLSENQIRFWLTRLRKLDTGVKSHRETLINTFVNAVYLYDEKVLIAFNYKDGTKTITFDEITAKDAPEGNSSDLGCFAPPRDPVSEPGTGFSVLWKLFQGRAGRRQM